MDVVSSREASDTGRSISSESSFQGTAKDASAASGMQSNHSGGQGAFRSDASAQEAAPSASHAIFQR